MAVDLKMEETSGHKVLMVRATGKLSKADYEQFIPFVERLISKQGKIRLVFAMHDFHGWEAGALWEDIKFDVKHFAHIERLAVVGERKWEELMAAFCKPFTTAQVRYFDQGQIEEAQDWIISD